MTVGWGWKRLFEGDAKVGRVWDHIKNGGRDPGVEYWVLDWVGFVPRKRESRRLEGPYMLSQSDIEGSTSHRDTIAYGGWWLNLHPPPGVDVPSKPPCAQHPLDHLFDIPLRCCFSKNIENLWMAGRNISATHVVFASTRVMATRAVHGQGGVPTSRALPGTQRWISTSVLRAWIELRWPKALRVGEIRLVFDTGLHRELTFSLSDHTNRNIVWGQGQPETVRDYEFLRLGAAGEWETLLTVEDNQPAAATASVGESGGGRNSADLDRGTHGVAEARIYEVRVYDT